MMAMEMTAETRGRKAKTQLCVYELRITLQEIRPPIWRLLQVPNSLPLNRLHDALQTVIGTAWSLRRFCRHPRWSVPSALPANVTGRPRTSEFVLRISSESVPGYAEFLEVVFEPGHEEYEHYVRWAGGPSPLNRSVGRFQPEEFNKMAVNDALSRMRWPGVSKRNDRPVLSRSRF
jgi:hypothetical protein